MKLKKYLMLASVVVGIGLLLLLTNSFFNNTKRYNSSPVIVEYGKENKQYLEFRDIASYYLLSSLSGGAKTKTIKVMKGCSTNNIYCKSMLGNAYFESGLYEKAFDFLVESQGDIKGYRGIGWAPSELALGKMYAMGYFVKKDREEAKHHFTKCALAGNQQCASWLISFIDEDLKSAVEFKRKRHYKGLDNFSDAGNLIYWYTAFPHIEPKLEYQNGNLKMYQHVRIKYLESLLTKKSLNMWRSGGYKLQNKFSRWSGHTQNVSSIHECLSYFKCFF